MSELAYYEVAPEALLVEVYSRRAGGTVGLFRLPNGYIIRREDGSVVAPFDASNDGSAVIEFEAEWGSL